MDSLNMELLDQVSSWEAVTVETRCCPIARHTDKVTWRAIPSKYAANGYALYVN